MTRPFPIAELNSAGWLRHQYTDEGKSTLQIAAALGCHQSTVAKALRRYGIEVRAIGRHRTEPESEEPRFPTGFTTYKCIECHSLTSHHRCLRCGGEAQKVVIFNRATGNVGDVWGLAPSESEIVALMTEGLNNKEIGLSLGITEANVNKQLTRARVKMGFPIGSCNRVSIARLWWIAQQEAFDEADDESTYSD